MGMPQPQAFTTPFVYEFYRGSQVEHKILDQDWDGDNEDDDDVSDPNDIGNGWKITGREVEYDLAYATEIKKGDMEVFAVNSSQYESIGEYEGSYIADEKSHLEQFMKDMGWIGSISESAVVMVWS